MSTLPQFFVQHKADINAEGATKGGRTVHKRVAEHCRLDMMQFLLNNGEKQDIESVVILPEANGYFAIADILGNFV